MQGVKPFIVFVLGLSVALQVQVTLFQSPDYLGLRVNLADFFMPFAGLFVLGSLIFKKAAWPVFSSRIVFVLIGLLIVAMSVALYQGYAAYGFSSWALYNKYCGFLILVSYFLLGAWLVSNQKPGEDLPRYFLQGFCGFMVLVLALSCISMFLPGWAGWLGAYAWEGFMVNRNAFMVVVIFAFFVMEIHRMRGDLLLPLWAHYLFWTLVPIFALYNASRTGWIVGCILILVFFFSQPLVFLKKLLPLLLFGAVFASASVPVVNNQEVMMGRQMQFFKKLIYEMHTPKKLRDDGNAVDREITYYGDQKRLIAVEDGLELYAQSNPVLGAGLGAYRPFQEAKRGEFIDVIDFTALWLLVETGAFGLAVFAAFFGFCMWHLYRVGFPRDGPPSSAHQALFFFLIAFAFMTLLHELTYTRFLWFVLGMGLAVPLAKRS